MRTVMVIGLAGLLGGIGYYFVTLEPRSSGSLAIQAKPQADPPTNTLTDAEEVFKKAFWRRPTADDKILHAERREWADNNGVQKWQWFIAVEPSPGLVKHLRDDNAFMLAPAASVPEIADAPAWFSFQASDVDVLQAPRGNMRLFFSKSKPLLYATDGGGGFRPGAPEPAKPVPAPTSRELATGRLPSSPPPTPSKP